MNKLKSLFESQKYIEIIDILTPALETTSELSPATHLDYLLYYGISLLEYSFAYEVEYATYSTQIRDYDYLVKNNQADPIAFKTIPEPISYVQRANQSLQAALSLLNHFFPENLNYIFITKIHLIRSAHLLKSTNFGLEVDLFIDFLVKIGAEKFEFERFAECLSEILEFEVSDGQRKMIRQELKWYYNELLCAEMKKVRWYGIFVSFGGNALKIAELRGLVEENSLDE